MSKRPATGRRGRCPFAWTRYPRAICARAEPVSPLSCTRVAGRRFVGPNDDSVLSCYLADLYDGQTLRQDRLSAWEALRERYGNRNESRLEGGSLRPAATFLP